MWQINCALLVVIVSFMFANAQRIGGPGFDRASFVRQYRMKNWPDYGDKTDVDVRRKQIKKPGGVKLPEEAQIEFLPKVTKATTRKVTTRRTTTRRPTTARPAPRGKICCKEHDVSPKCYSRCNFDQLNKKVLTALFLGSDACPRKYGGDLLVCAAQEEDHTTCCRRRNVQRTTAKEKCLSFCDQGPRSTFQVDLSMLPCWGVLEDIKACYKEGIIKAHG